MPDIPQVQLGAAVTIAYGFLTTQGAQINMATASAITLHLRKPNGKVIAFGTSDGVTFKNGGTDGVVKFVTTARVGGTTGHLDTAGTWSGQFDASADDYSGPGTVFTFRVRESLESSPSVR